MTAQRARLAIGAVCASIVCAVGLCGGLLGATDATAQPRLSPEAPRDEARTFAAGNVSETAIVAALASAQPDRFRPIGTSSVTFQVDLAGRVDAAFKPESRIHPRGWLAEVAAYRIARELGLDDVPPAVVRSVERWQLRRRFEPGRDGLDVDAVSSELVFTGNAVRGAFIYWVPGLLRSDLDSAAGIARWSEWLAQEGEIPDGQRATARDLSNVLVFDYLIGNRDRWSGGNLSPTAEGRIVIRDHNLAFPYALGAGVQQRMIESLKRTQRFSRRMIARLIALDEPALRAIAADDSLLDDRQIRDVMDRRATILTYVGALIEEHGREAVLFFR
ncbi:MAG: hypothetical protein M3Y87_13045 [Myxococcota bacterium]|nr:hypothetical protein [Myxococcota bacterium]